MRVTISTYAAGRTISLVGAAALIAAHAWAHTEGPEWLLGVAAGLLIVNVLFTLREDPEDG